MARKYQYRIRAKVWLYPGPSPWHFVTLPKKHGAHIRGRFGWLRKTRKGWGSIRVSVTAGRTTWETSIFPEKKSGSYVPPLKEKVRALEGLQAGKTITFLLRISGQPAPKRKPAPF